MYAYTRVCTSILPSIGQFINGLNPLIFFPLSLFCQECAGALYQLRSAWSFHANCCVGHLQEFPIMETIATSSDSLKRNVVDR